MGDEEREHRELEEDGRPVEVREGETPQSDEDKEEDIPDEGTIEGVGY